jgi:hypothetical protein
MKMPIAADPVPALSNIEAAAPRQVEAFEPEAIAPPPAANGKELPPQVRRAFRVIKRDLEDLLTLLSADASINR